MNLLHLPPEMLAHILEFSLEPLLLDPIRALRRTCKAFCFIINHYVSIPVSELSLEEFGDDFDHDPDVIFFRSMIPFLNKQFKRDVACNALFNVPAFVNLHRISDLISTWWDIYVKSPCIVKSDGGMFKEGYCSFSDGLFVALVFSEYDGVESDGFVRMCYCARRSGMRFVGIIQQRVTLNHAWIPVLKPSCVYTLREHVELNQRHE